MTPQPQGEDGKGLVGVPGPRTDDRIALEWRPIESVPRDGTRFLAAIHHGDGYRVVEARRVGPGVHHVAEDSCVGWRPGHAHPAYWLPLPPPPESGADDDGGHCTPLTPGDSGTDHKAVVERLTEFVSKFGDGPFSGDLREALTLLQQLQEERDEERKSQEIVRNLYSEEVKRKSYWVDQTEAAEARILVLEEALKPFADAYDFWSDQDGGVSDTIELDDQGQLKMFNLRRARSALTPGACDE